MRTFLSERLFFASVVVLESVCQKHERITVILPRRDRLQKPARKEARIAESCRDTFVDLVLSGEVDFLADVAAGRLGIRGYGYRAATCIECVIRRRQP